MNPAVLLFRHPLLPALICALLWGSAFPAIKTVYTHWEHQGLERTQPLIFLFAGVRFCLAGSGLLVFGKGLRQELRATPWRPLLVLGLTQTLIQYVFFYQSVAVSSASLAALLVATGSFWWMLFSPLLQKTPWPKPAQWLGLGLGGIGVTLAVHAPGTGAGNPTLGATFMLTATASGAIAILFYQRVSPTMSSINATGLSLAMGGLGLCLLGIPALPMLSQMFTLPVIITTLWLCFVSAAAFSIWNHLSTLFPVTLLASYRFLIPICGVLEALILLKSETPGWGLIVGGTLVVISMALARRFDRKRPSL